MRNNTENAPKFYRNKKDVQVDGVTIDECSLWELKDGLLVLVDDDQHITMVPSTNFELAE